MQRPTVPIFLIAAQLVLASCAAGPAPAPSTGNPPESTVSRDSQARLAALFQARGDGSREDDYRIASGDMVKVRIFGAGPLSGWYTVDRDGSILFPLIDQVRAEGQTEEGLARIIAARLGEQYLESPSVEVSVKKFQGRRVAVLGAVRKPGFYSVDDPGASILDLINEAGGLKRSSGTRLYFTPAGSESGHQVLLASQGSPLENPIEIDLTQFARGRLVPAFSLPVRPGDALYVEEAGKVVVDGWVRVPKPVQIRPGLSLVQAITDAGGLHFAASPGSVVVSRKGREGPGETHRFDYEELAAGHRRDFLLQAGDRVHVAGNPVKVSAWAFYAFVTGVVNVAIGGYIPFF